MKTSSPTVKLSTQPATAFHGESTGFAAAARRQPAPCNPPPGGGGVDHSGSSRGRVGRRRARWLHSSRRFRRDHRRRAAAFQPARDPQLILLLLRCEQVFSQDGDLPRSFLQRFGDQRQVHLGAARTVTAVDPVDEVRPGRHTQGFFARARCPRSCPSLPSACRRRTGSCRAAAPVPLRCQAWDDRDSDEIARLRCLGTVERFGHQSLVPQRVP